MFKTGLCKKVCSLAVAIAVVITTCTALLFTPALAEGTTQENPYFAISTDKDAYGDSGYGLGDTAKVTVELFEGDGTDAASKDYYIKFSVKSDFNDAVLPEISDGSIKAYKGKFTFTVKKPTAGYVFITMKLYKDENCTVSANNVISQSSIGFGTDKLSQSETTNVDLTKFLTENVINRLGLNEKQPQRNARLSDIVEELKTADEVKYGRFVFKNDDTDLSDGMVSTFTDYKIENGAPTTESDEYVAAYEKYWLEQTREPGITVICKPIPQQEIDNFGLAGSQALNDFDIYDIKVETAVSKNTDGSDFTRPLSGTFTVPKNAALSSCRMYVSFGGYGTYIAYPTCYLGAKDACILSVNNHGIPNELTTAAARLMSGDDLDANDGIDTINKGCDSVDKMEGSIDRNKTVETSFYMQTVLRAGRALQFIESLAEWDGINATVNGGSYGGYQSIVAAALDGLRGDNAIVGWCDPSVPWMCEPGSENGGYFGSSFRPAVWDVPGTDSVLPTYFNAVNYGKLIRCVTTIHAGLGDDVCPPAGINILYNVMENTCDNVSIDFTQERLHSESPNLALSRRKDITYVYKNEKAAAAAPDENGYVIQDVITYNGDGAVQMVQKNVLTEYTGTDTALVIPEKVTAIADNAFLNNTAIGSITFASDTNCVKIGNSAFKGCKKLTEVKLPSSLRRIGNNAFQDCSALKTLCGMPNGGGKAFGENLVSIGESAFNSCKSLRDIINIPSGVSTVSGFCFFNCKSVGGVTLAEGVNTVGVAAFSNCNMVEIIIPESCTSIAHAAFEDSGAPDQKTIRRIFIKGETSIAYTAGVDNDAFKGIDTSKVKIYGLADSSAKAYADKCGATFVTLGALSEYESLLSASPVRDFTYEGSDIAKYNGSDTTVITPYSYGTGKWKFSLSTVRDTAFKSNTNLKRLVFTEGITTVYDSAFANCNHLISVTYPETVTRLGEWHDNLYSLKEVTVLSSTVEIPKNWLGVGTNYEAITFYGYTGSTLEKWCQENRYTFSALDRPSEIKPTEDDAADFVCSGAYITEYRGNNTTVVTPSAVGTYKNENGKYITTTEQRVTKIADYINGISDVKTLIVSEGITTIGAPAFKEKCESLETLVLPSTVTDVGSWHEDLSHIKSITVLNPNATIDINWLGSPTDTNNTTDFDNLVCYGVLNADGSSTLKTWCENIKTTYGKRITFVACDKNGTISTDSEIVNGKIVLKAANGNKIVNGSKVYGGASVTVTVQPADGYKLVPNSIKIKGFSYGEYSDLPINVANAADPTGNTFTVKLPTTLISADMPENGELVVTAEFEPITSASASMLGVQTRVRTASNGDPIYDMRFIARLNVVGKTFNIDGKNASVISCGMLAAEEALLGTNADALLRLNSTSPASADFDAVSDNVRLSVASSYCGAPENGTYLDIALSYYDLENSYGINEKDLYSTPISARAFMQYKTADGAYGVIYSDIITRTGKNAVSNVR